MNALDFFLKYCNKENVCWQLLLASEYGFDTTDMLKVCAKCKYFEEQ